MIGTTATDATTSIDIAILGGGIAGLWALNVLRAAGYGAVLLECERIGGGQSMQAQGIVHGGLKFSLDGKLSPAGKVVSAMPAAWQRCLEGSARIDLQQTRVLADHMHLVAGGSASANLESVMDSDTLGRQMRRLSLAETPVMFSGITGKTVYRLQETVVDVPSLMRNLATPHRQFIFSLGQPASLQVHDGSALVQLPTQLLAPRVVLLACGAGNGELLEQLGANAPQMQRRPLQQVLVRHEYAAPVFAHFAGSGSTPRLTITSHRNRSGHPVWYLGGALAEKGAYADADELIATAQEELQRLLPAVRLGHCNWATQRVDRAEVRTVDGARPDDVFLDWVDSVDNALVTWPTKLALGPRLGAALLAALLQRNVHPSRTPGLEPFRGLAQADYVSAPWENLL